MQQWLEARLDACDLHMCMPKCACVTDVGVSVSVWITMCEGELDVKFHFESAVSQLPQIW